MQSFVRKINVYTLILLSFSSYEGLAQDEKIAPPPDLQEISKQQAEAEAKLGTSNTVSAPTSPHSFSGNAAVYSQYIFRGITQSNRHPAFQFGVDYSHVSGLYLGSWASSITWIRDSGWYVSNPSANMELDIYGGYKHTFESNKDFSFDIGFLRYNYFGYYPDTFVGGIVKPNTNETYASIIWKWLSLKYSYSLGNTFGVLDARGTSYLDLTATIPLTQTIMLMLHAGRQSYKGTSYPAKGSNDEMYSYSDYRVDLSKSFSNNWQIGVGASEATEKDIGYYFSGAGISPGKKSLYVYAKKTI